MKRLIVYTNEWSDEHEFSDCSTRFECLPEVVDDSAGFEELKELAKKYGYKLTSSRWSGDCNRYRQYMTHSIKTRQTKPTDTGCMLKGEVKQKPVYIAFVQFQSNGALKANIDCSQPKDVTDEQEYDILNNQDYGAVASGEHVDGGSVFIANHWEFEVQLKLLGYNPKSFYERFEHHGFDDDTYSCYECGKYDDRDDGYTNNHRIVNGCELLGINCGCFEEFAKNNLDEYINDHENCIELNLAEQLETEGKLKHVERFIGGMTDGRGGYWRGYGECREGTPESVLKELLNENPSAEYVFTHDESGQFQTYFSVWQYKKGA